MNSLCMHRAQALLKTLYKDPSFTSRRFHKLFQCRCVWVNRCFLLRWWGPLTTMSSWFTLLCVDCSCIKTTQQFFTPNNNRSRLWRDLELTNICVQDALYGQMVRVPPPMRAAGIQTSLCLILLTTTIEVILYPLQQLVQDVWHHLERIDSE